MLVVRVTSVVDTSFVGWVNCAMQSEALHML